MTSGFFVAQMRKRTYHDRQSLLVARARKKNNNARLQMICPGNKFSKMFSFPEPPRDNELRTTSGLSRTHSKTRSLIPVIREFGRMFWEGVARRGSGEFAERGRTSEAKVNIYSGGKPEGGNRTSRNVFTREKPSTS